MCLVLLRALISRKARPGRGVTWASGHAILQSLSVWQAELGPPCGAEAASDISFQLIQGPTYHPNHIRPGPSRDPPVLPVPEKQRSAFQKVRCSQSLSLHPLFLTRKHARRRRRHTTPPTHHLAAATAMRLPAGARLALLLARRSLSSASSSSAAAAHFPRARAGEPRFLPSH